MKKETPTFFSNQDSFREWLKENHDKEAELWVGFYKKSTRIPSITWPESVDQALCFGWIDGIRKSIDEKSYKIRFTSRKKTSHWSAVNIKKMKELKERRLMTPAGEKAFRHRKPERSMNASYEQKKVALLPEYKNQIKANTSAWKHYQTLSPYLKKTSDWWVMSAKREGTRQRRLKILIQSCEEKKKIPPLRLK